MRKDYNKFHGIILIQFIKIYFMYIFQGQNSEGKDEKTNQNYTHKKKGE
jgi:hypothetical protein